MLRASRLVPAALLAGVLIVAGTSLFAAASNLPFGTYSRDIRTLCTDAGAQLPELAGGVSLLNLMVWASIASTAALVAALVPTRRRWLLGFAGLVLLFALDDAFLFHDDIGIRLGVPEKGVYLLYAALGLPLLVSAVRPVTKQPPAEPRWALRLAQLPSSSIAFLLGTMLLGISVLVDQAVYGHHLLEDAPKLMGALVWLTVPALHLPVALFRGLDRTTAEGAP